MEVDIRIDLDVKINPKTPPTTLEQIHINQAEGYIKSKLYAMAKKLEAELNEKWDKSRALDRLAEGERK